MNTYIFKNSFTGYTATVKIKGENTPSISTMEKHFRKSKAKNCMSLTNCHDDQTGERIVIQDLGKGKEIVRVNW